MRDYVPEYFPVCGKIPLFAHTFFPQKSRVCMGLDGFVCARLCSVVPVYPEFFGTPQGFSHNNRPVRSHVVWIRSSTKMGITKRRPERPPVRFGFSACAFTVRESMWRRNVSPHERGSMTFWGFLPLPCGPMKPALETKQLPFWLWRPLRIEAYHPPAASGYPPAFLASNASLKQRCV